MVEITTTTKLNDMETQIKEISDQLQLKLGLREVETGLAPPHLWDLVGDRKRQEESQVLQVARLNKIISDEKYMILLSKWQNLL